VAATHVLVAMQGAALTHAVFLPDGAAVVEIARSPDALGRFGHLARLRGLAHYAHIHQGGLKINSAGEHYRLDSAALARLVACVATRDRRRPDDPPCQRAYWNAAQRTPSAALWRQAERMQLERREIGRFRAGGLAPRAFRAGPAFDRPRKH
jgi:hypothetical protein